MFRKVFGAALISTAAVIAGPALAGPGGGHGVPPGAGAQVGMPMGRMTGPAPTGVTRMNSQPSMRMPMTTMRSGTRSPVRLSSASRTRASVRSGHRLAMRASTKASMGAKSQGLLHASITAIEHASPRSALARGAVQASALPGLNTGATVKGKGGTTIGTVSRIVTGTDGKIRLVVATTSTGRTIRLVPNTLSISGGVVTTTMV